MDDQRIRDDLDTAASGVDVGDSSAALEGVRTAVKRRRRRRTALGVVGATIVVTAGVATFVTNRDSAGDDVIRSASPSTAVPVTTAAEAAADEAPMPTAGPTSDPATDDAASADPATVDDPAPTSAIEVVEVVAVDAVALHGVGDADGVASVQWLVPWRDGFLAVGNDYEPQPLPTELPPEISELFPAEVIELFADGLPATIDEATVMLSEAGLLDEVTEVISANQEVYDAIYSAPASAPLPLVRFSIDGENWDSVEFTLPPGFGTLQQVAVAGDRLVAVLAPQSAIPSGITVASTVDLTNWSIQTIDTARPASLPADVEFTAWPSGVAVNDAGWVLGVDTNAYVSIEQFLPAEITELMSRGGGMSMTETDDGLEIELSVGEGAELQEYVFTTAELGIADELLPYLTGASSNLTVWAAPFDGTPVASEITGFGGLLAATPAGFVRIDGEQIHVSPDAVEWLSSDIPLENQWVNAILTVPDGIVALVQDRVGEIRMYRTGPPFTDWVPFDVPGKPDFFSGVYGSSSSGPALVIDAAQPPFFDATIAVEFDGYRFTQHNSRLETSYDLVDLATGDLVLTEAIDQRTADYSASGSFEFAVRADDGAMSFVDPETGHELVFVPADTMQQAVEASFSEHEAADAYQPDAWLLAAIDDGRWLVDDLDDGDPGSYFGSANVAVNGDTLLVSTADGFVRYDLGS